MVDHKAIVDSERHEPKGAGSATTGQIAKSNGDGTTSFVSPSTLVNTVSTVVLSQGSIISQTPSALDTALKVVYGSAVSNTDVTLDALGNITLNTTNFYDIEITLNFGRAIATGDVTTLARLLVNGSAVEYTEILKIPDLNITVPFKFRTAKQFAASTVITVEIANDSGGSTINSGGLKPFTPTVLSWAVVPSSYVKITKVVGAS